MDEPIFRYWLGVDLGSRSHQAQLISGDGASVGERAMEHGGQGIAQFLEWLRRSTGGADPGTVAVAVEAPRGAVIDALMEAGYAVFSINPKQLDRFRDRFSVAGAKDDRRDARVLAHSLRTDAAHFRAVQADEPRLVRLRELSRAEEALGDDLRRAANQLWSYLQRYFPALLQLCPGADEAWLWDLLDQAHGLPHRTARLRRPALGALLARHRIRRVSPDELHEKLRHPLPLAAGVDRALAEQVLLLLPRLRLLEKQKADIAARIQELIDELADDENFPEHRSLTILRSVPGVGRGFTATVLAEAFAPLTTGDYHVLRALSGVAPVTQQSGAKKLIQMRRACNRRLREALFHAANVHAQRDGHAHQNYLRLRQRGQTHARAVRGVADRMLDLLCTLIRRQTPYDPLRRDPQQPAAA